MGKKYSVDDILADLQVKRNNENGFSSNITNITENKKSNIKEAVKETVKVDIKETQSKPKKLNIEQKVNNTNQDTIIFNPIKKDNISENLEEDYMEFDDSISTKKEKLHMQFGKNAEIEKVKKHNKHFSLKNKKDNEQEDKISNTQDINENREQKENFKLNIKKDLFLDYDNKTKKDNVGAIKDDFNGDKQHNKNDFRLNIKENNNEQDEEDSLEDIEDYCSPKDEELIKKDISSIKTGLIIRAFITTILFGVAMYYNLPFTAVPEFMYPSGDTLVNFIGVNTALVLLTMLVNSNTVWSGILGFFTFKGDSDTLPTFLSVATLCQGVAFIVKPDAFLPSKLNLFFPVAILVILFNIIGKIYLIKRIKNNFEILSSESKKYGLITAKNKNVIDCLSKNLGSSRDKIVYYCKTRWLSSFLEISYTEDQTDEICRFLSPICVIGSIIIGVITYFFTRSIFHGITASTLILCLCTPITSTLVTNVPLYKMCKKLSQDGAIISGYSAVDEFSQTDTVVLNAPDIFKPENVILHGIKPIDKTQIDNVITDAASVLVQCYGTLSDMFLQLIGNDRTMLKKVDSVVYKDSMGLSAVVDGKEVLIGNRELMKNSGIQVPSKQYEKQFVKDSRNIVYLSNSGKLVAIFVISYRADEEFTEHLNRLIDEGIDLVVYTVDPNITAEMVADVVDVPSDYVTVMPSKIHGIYQKNTDTRKKVPATIGFFGKASAMLRSISASIHIKNAMKRAVFAQLLFIVAGYSIATFLSFMGHLSLVTSVYIIAFQFLTGVIVMLLSKTTKI